MRRIFSPLVCLSLVFLGMGCQTNKTRVGEGAVIGTVLGAAVGGIVGQQSHHGAEGAVIGGAVGALTGVLVGSQINKPGQQAANQTAQPAQAQAQNPNQMTTQQIIDLTKQGVHEAVIIDRIRMTNSKFSLTADDVASLKSQGVSQQVINVMQGL
jgi:uncharacterized protein YcfJ